MKAVDVTTTDGTRSFFSACSGSARWRGGKVLLTGNHHHVGDMVSFQQPWTAPRYFIKRYLLGQVVTKVCSHVTVVFRHHLLGGVVEEIPSHLYLRSGNFALHGFCLNFSAGSCLESMINHLVMVQLTSRASRSICSTRCASWSVICHMSYVICLCGLYGKKVRLSGKVYQSSWRTEESPKLYQVGMRGQVSRVVLASVGGGGSP